MWPKPIFDKINTFIIYTLGKSGTKIWATSVFFQKLPKVNNRPLGENSPNLVTLLKTDITTGANPTTSEFTTTTPALS
jgi:hypothetical protein